MKSGGDKHNEIHGTQFSLLLPLLLSVAVAKDTYR